MSETPEGVGGLFRAGKLAAAIEAANAAVRKSPADIAPRVLLAELLLFAGNLERADTLLSAAGDIEPQAAIVVAEFRQLLRAEMARRQLHRDGRLPEFLGEPTQALAATLEAFVALRAGDAAGGSAKAAEAERRRPRVRGAAGGAAFDDFRDVDDLTAGFFEVLTTTGKYFWIPTERVETVEFHPPKRARDLFWRRVSMSVRAGPDGDVYLPVTYVAGDPALGDEYRLGRATDWRQEGDGPVRGVGQRVFLAGDEPVSIMDMTTLAFEAPAAAP